MRASGLSGAFKLVPVNFRGSMLSQVVSETCQRGSEAFQGLPESFKVVPGDFRGVFKGLRSVYGGQAPGGLRGIPEDIRSI